MSDFNGDTLFEAYLKGDDNLVEEHLKRGIKLTPLDIFLKDYYDFRADKLLLRSAEKDLGPQFFFQLMDTFKLLMTENQPKQKHLLLACELGNVVMIVSFLNHRMTFNKECFDLWIGERETSPISYVTRDYLCSTADTIELFIAAGLEITIDVVIALVYKDIYVHDIERFNLDFNDEFHKACEEKCFWPYSPQYVPFKIADIKRAIYESCIYVYKQLIDSYDKLPTAGDMINYCVDQRSTLKIEFLYDLPVSGNELEIAKKYDLSQYVVDTIEKRLKNNTV